MIAQRMDQSLLQVADHTDDTDSIPEGHAGQVIGDGTSLVQRSQSLLQTEDHFNDTEDVPLEQEATQMRGTAQRRMHADEADVNKDLQYVYKSTGYQYREVPKEEEEEQTKKED